MTSAREVAADLLSRADWSDAATAILGLSTLVLGVQSYRTRQRDKRRTISVRMAWGYTPHGPELGPEMLLLTAANPGDRAVTIQAPAIELPDGSSLVFLDPQSNVRYPHTLEEGKNCMLWCELRPVAMQLKQRGFSGTVTLKPYVRDAVDGTHRGAPFTLTLESWTSPAS